MTDKHLVILAVGKLLFKLVCLSLVGDSGKQLCKLSQLSGKNSVLHLRDIGCGNSFVEAALGYLL